jgi:hypothetical protein
LKNNKAQLLVYLEPGSMSVECATTPTKDQLDAGLNLYVPTYGSYTISSLTPASDRQIKLARKNK